MPKRLQAEPSPLQRRIRERRLQLKKSMQLTQTDIAIAIGIESPEFITMVEQGRRNLDLNKIPQLAKILKLDSKELCRMALYEAAPGLYAALFDSLVPPAVTSLESLLPAAARSPKEDEDEGDGEEPGHPITVQNELVYPVELLTMLPQTLQKAVERLIEDLHRYACPPYRDRDSKL